MSDLLSLFSGGGIGTALSAVTGLLGGWLTKRENRLVALEENRHEAAMAELDMRADQMQHAANIKLADKKYELAQKEGEIAADLITTQSLATVEEIDAKGFAAAIKEAQGPTGYPVIDKIRALTRPFLTASLYLFVVVIFGLLHYRVNAIAMQELGLMMELYIYIVKSTVYLFIMAVSWWFMSRGEKTAQQIKGLL